MFVNSRDLMTMTVMLWTNKICWIFFYWT